MKESIETGVVKEAQLAQVKTKKQVYFTYSSIGLTEAYAQYGSKFE